jgi:hypothetical protein
LPGSTDRAGCRAAKSHHPLSAELYARLMNTARKGKFIVNYFNWLLVKDANDTRTILDTGGSIKSRCAQQESLDYLQ